MPPDSHSTLGPLPALNRFSEINPEEYARLQEAERQKQILEQQMELRARQMESPAQALRSWSATSGLNS